MTQKFFQWAQNRNFSVTKKGIFQWSKKEEFFSDKTKECFSDQKKGIFEWLKKICDPPKKEYFSDKTKGMLQWPKKRNFSVTKKKREFFSDPPPFFGWFFSSVHCVPGVPGGQRLVFGDALEAARLPRLHVPLEALRLRLEGHLEVVSASAGV